MQSITDSIHDLTPMTPRRHLRVTAAAGRCQQRVAEHSERIAQTDAEADGVRAETKALAAQWRDSLAQLRAADAAMQVCTLLSSVQAVPKDNLQQYEDADQLMPDSAFSTQACHVKC
jgi:vacuolar-type H+-ATPase subunit I/STV1